MRTKLVAFLVAVGLLGLAAWFVHQENSNHQSPITPEVHGGERRFLDSEVPEKYRLTIARALEYLRRHQHKDGHWEGDDGKYPVAMTGLAGLALIMDLPYQRMLANPSEKILPIADAADWLMNRSIARRDGLIFSDHPSETSRYMEGHGCATVFLAGVLMHEPDDARRKKLRDVLTGAVRYIVKSQSTQGGWYHTSKLEGHDFDAVATTAILIQALRAAEYAGIPVPPDVINDAQEYMKSTVAKYELQSAPQNRDRLFDTAATLACGSVARWREDRDKLCLDRFKYCQSEISVSRNSKVDRDELLHYYFAQAAFHVGYDNWQNYRTMLFDHLQSTQNKDGGWPAGEGIGVGPVYSTAIWSVVLQLDRRNHPAVRIVELPVK